MSSLTRGIDTAVPVPASVPGKAVNDPGQDLSVWSGIHGVALLVFYAMVVALIFDVMSTYRGMALDRAVAREALQTGEILLDRTARLGGGIAPVDRTAAQHGLDVWVEGDTHRELPATLKYYGRHVDSVKDFTLCVQHDDRFAIYDSVVATSESERTGVTAFGKGVCSDAFDHGAAP